MAWNEGSFFNPSSFAFSKTQAPVQPSLSPMSPAGIVGNSSRNLAILSSFQMVCLAITVSPFSHSVFYQ